MAIHANKIWMIAGQDPEDNFVEEVFVQPSDVSSFACPGIPIGAGDDDVRLAVPYRDKPLNPSLRANRHTSQTDTQVTRPHGDRTNTKTRALVAPRRAG